jgi:hypothetical protein
MADSLKTLNLHGRKKMNIQTIEITLAARQTPESRFSHFEGTEQELLTLVFDNFFSGRQGAREGILSIAVPPARFKSGVASLTTGDILQGTFEARREGETPRKVITTIGRKKLPARYVEVILYRRDVLEEDPSYTASADWEIISINASPTTGPTPVPPSALIANHFEMSGGTNLGYTSEEFEAALKESVMFWHDKSMCG